MTQISLNAGINGATPLPTKNQKNDIAYLTELVSELQQLDSLLALNESRRRLSAVSLQRDCDLMGMFAGCGCEPMDYCSQLVVRHSRDILLREIVAVEHRLNGETCNAKSKTAFPFGDVFNSECCRQSKVVKFAKFDHKANGDVSSKKLRKSTVVFPRPQKKGNAEEEMHASKKDADEGLGEVQDEKPQKEYTIVAGRGSKTSEKSDELEDGDYGSIVEKMTDNGNFRMCCKILFPTKTEKTNYNMIGRILGPRGISIRQMEAKYGCRILIRGKGSVKNPHDEARLRRTPAGKHLNDDLHVLITVEKPFHDQCLQKITMAKAFVEKLLATPDFDDFKRAQLIQLAIINGTYRNNDGNNNCANSASKAAPTSLLP